MGVTCGCGALLLVIGTAMAALLGWWVWHQEESTPIPTLTPSPAATSVVPATATTAATATAVPSPSPTATVPLPTVTPTWGPVPDGRCAPLTFNTLPVEGGQPVIKIGVPVPLSSPGNVRMGKRMKTAIQIAAQQINDRGGVLGRYRVEPLFYDSAGDPERGRDVAEQAITQDCVVGLVGEHHSAPGLAEAEVAHKYRVPVLFVDAWNNRLTGSHYPEVFRTAPASDMVSQALAQFFLDQGVQWIAIVTEKNAFGENMSACYQQVFEDAGLPSQVYWLASASEVDAPLEKLRQDLQQHPGRKAIYVLLIGQPGFTPFVREGLAQGLTPSDQLLWVVPSTAADSRWFWQELPQGEGMVFRSVSIPPKMLRQWYPQHPFFAAYEEAVGREVTSTDYIAVAAYDAFNLFVRAIEDAGALAPDALIAALEAYDRPENGVEGLLGTYYFPYGLRHPLPASEPDWMWHQWPDVPILFIQYWQAGQPIDQACIVWPDQWATCDLNQPPH